LLQAPADKTDFQDATRGAEHLHQLARELLGAAEQFVKTRDIQGLERLREFRFKIAAALIELPAAELNAAIPNVLPVIIACCMKSGVRILPRSQAEDELFARCVGDLTPWRPEQKPAQGIAALLMCWHAFELKFVPAIASLPPAVKSIWLEFLFETPNAFVKPGDADAFASYLHQLSARVDAYMSHASSPDVDLTAAFNRAVLFMQNYFNELNLRDTMRARGKIIERILENSGSDLDQLRVLRATRERPRIGFISLNIFDGTETVFLAAHLEHLDHGRYDVRLYSLHEPMGVVGGMCRTWAQTYVRLPEKVDNAVARLRTEDLDLAIFCTNMTAVTNPLTQIAAHRVARTQVSTIASPVTTGLRNVDVMISGEANETAESPAHYTEQLICIPGALNCYPFQYMTEGLPEPTAITRTSLGIPENCTLFFSSANFFKILPELSQLWAEILRQVPDSYLMLMPFNPSWSNNYPVDSFVFRLNSQLAEVGLQPDRIRLVASVPTIVHLHKIIALADVFLDSFPFSGACTLYDPLTVGVPIVARMGKVCRSRHSKAILEEAELADWVTGDDASYIRAAVELGRNPEKRRGECERLARVSQVNRRLCDTANYAAKLMPTFDRLNSEWDKKVEALHSADPVLLNRRIDELSRKVGKRLPSFTDLNLVTSVVLSYLRDSGSRRLVDVGACMGAMTKPFLAEGWQAVMFEPDERCHPQLAALAQLHAGSVSLEKAAVTTGHTGSVAFHVASMTGLSGLSVSPFASDVATTEVPAVSLNKYIADKGWNDIDFIKIDAEGFDLDILRSVDLGRVTPRLIMVEFGEHFASQDRAAIAAAIQEMRSRKYRACVVCLRATGDFQRHEWETCLLAIGIDELPASTAGEKLFGNILFFRDEDRDFLPSLCDWLEHLDRWQ
jgi:FkbM family methyltransferase